ncbi:MAG: citrate/2-methylcitrate synthase [Thermoplasmata archaeon]|nr:citrate/2-methylcitrate synthase [Thermoplasmata archaeon]
MKNGLEGVEVLTTRISYIDGDEGYLEYRGHDIRELADLDYETVSYLLLFGNLPSADELTDWSSRLRAERNIDDNMVDVMKICNFNIEAMDALRTAISFESHCDMDLNDNSQEANVRKAIRLIAKFPTIIAAFWRINNGKKVMQPDPELSHGANFLYMLRGERPSELEARAIETDFIISAEHELNASTFSARVTASTLSDLHSSVISGISTLNGPLHGGARMEVMQYMEKILTSEAAEEFVKEKIAHKERIMGFGHRVYKTYDPRARIYKDLARTFANEHPEERWFEIAETIENTVNAEFVEKKGKPIYTNVDYWSAVVYEYLGLSPRLATSLFAIARVSGWIAHVLEQYADNRLIRPRATSIRQS